MLNRLPGAVLVTESIFFITATREEYSVVIRRKDRLDTLSAQLYAIQLKLTRGERRTQIKKNLKKSEKK